MGEAMDFSLGLGNRTSVIIKHGTVGVDEVLGDYKRRG